MLKNLYIRRGDESFWDRAEQMAKAQNVALSVWVTNLIRRHIYALGTKQTSELTIAELLDGAQSQLDQVKIRLQEAES